MYQPVSDASSSTHRPTGMNCTTIKYTAKACRFGPYAERPVMPSGSGFVLVAPIG
jgi:hypothetical protein